MGLQLYMDAFWALCSCRLQSGRIPWTAVQSYSDTLKLDRGEAQDMHFLVGQLDMVYVQWLKKKGTSNGEHERPSRQVEPSLKGHPSKR